MWWWHQQDFGWWMLFGWMWMALIWGLIIVGIVWVVRSLTRSGNKTSGEDPLEIARRRYAAGELTREEYEEMTSLLRSK
ncbi:MAG: SHOCT domain-containing protein [Chloroflexi bacterium]|nr:SHOCT domain-containing protein [Chloroflexota bacterium]MDA1217937.1 SHOCT domain-containing protein [Chloroflexota bacterium]